ncbi:25833_t:CDS:2, partial [Gigaspora rosea]
QITSAEIKKLLDNQGKLMHKVDRLMARFEEMEERIDSRLRAVEDKLFATLDVSELQLFVESTVKGATNALIKKTIYPTQQELKEAVEDYLEENNYDFLQGFRNRKSKWDAYYEKNFYNPTMHSKRGTLTTKTKDAVFAKQSAKTKAAYSKLFSPIVANDPEDTYISRILTKVFPKGKPEENLIAFGIGVAQALLSPKYEKITIEEKIMKDRIEKNVAILLNKGTFVISDDDDSDSS